MQARTVYRNILIGAVTAGQSWVLVGAITDLASTSPFEPGAFLPTLLFVMLGVSGFAAMVFGWGLGLFPIGITLGWRFILSDYQRRKTYVILEIFVVDEWLSEAHRPRRR